MARKDYRHLYKAYERGSEEEAALSDSLKVILKTAHGTGHYESDMVGPVDCLMRSIQIAWEKLISDPFFSDGRRQPKDVTALYKSIKVGNPKDVLKSYERIVNTDVSGSAVSAMYDFLTEVSFPAEQADKAIKKAIKGDRPGLLDAGFGTCPCCFNIQGVKGEKMVTHGFRKPDRWSRTPSCDGTGEPPLELSLTGLEKLIERQRNWVDWRKEEINNPDAIEHVWVQGKGNLERTAPGFDAALSRYLKSLPDEVEVGERELTFLEDKLKEWSEKLEPSLSPSP